MPNLDSYVLNVIFGLISAGLLALCRHLNKKLKDYQLLLEKQEYEDIEDIINKKLEPIQESIGVLKAYINEVASKGEVLRAETISSWGYRITQLCELYLKQKYMTQEQYAQLREMYDTYVHLGGNGKTKALYLKTTETLEVKEQ